MANDGSIVLSTQIDQTGLNKGMKSMKSGVSSMSKAFGKLGIAIAAAFSVKALINFGKETSKLYDAQIEAETKLATIMRQRMGASDEQINKIKELTQAEQALGIIGDEVQLAGAQQLATFAMQSKTLETLIPAMNNLVAQQRGFNATQSDAVSVANLMGKALMGQATALRRVGITFTEAEEKMLKYGDESQRAATLAQVIKNNVGEMNRTLAQTDAGRQKQLANTIGDIKEQFGEVFKQLSILLLPVLQKVADILGYIAMAAKRAAQGIAEMFGKKLQTAPAVIGEAVENQNALTEAIEETTKAQNGAVASFDEVTSLTQNSADAQKDIANATASSVIPSLENDVVPENTITQFDYIIDKMKIIGEYAGKIWKSEPIQTFVTTAKKGLSYMVEFYSTLGKSLINNTKTTFANIEGNLKKTGRNIAALWTNVWSDIGNGIDNWGKPIISGVDNLFNSIWQTSIDPAVQLITQVWADFTGTLVTLWAEHGQFLIDNIGNFVKTTIDLFQSLYDNILEPIITPIFETVSWLWEKHIQPLVKKIGDFILTLVNGAMEIYNEVIAPLVMWLTEELAPAWSFLSSLVTGVFGSIIAVISDTVGSIIGVLSGLIDFITGVFTGNWKKAWNGVSNIFKNIMDNLWGIIKFPLNLIIDGINALISGLNKVSIDIPDWVPAVGGKKFGFSIPKIPKLATGGIVPHQTLAMLGEGNKKEAVLPLEQNTGWMDMLADRLADRMGGGVGGRIEVPVIIDGREVARATRQAEDRMGTQTVFGGFANAY